MKASDVSSSKGAVASGAARKFSRLKLVSKTTAHDQDKPDATLVIKAKAVKTKTDAKPQDNTAASNAPQGQFSTLLGQVEKKLTAAQGQPDADEDDTSSDDLGKEDAGDGERDSSTSEIKSQNGTTSLFAGAFMLRGWEPALIAKADVAATKDGAGDAPAAANTNMTLPTARIIDSKLPTSAKPIEAKATPVVAHATDKPSAAPAQVNLSDAPQMPNVAAVAAAAVAPQIQATVAIQTKLQVQTSSPTVTADPASAQTAADTVAAAQASGMITSIHVEQVDGEHDQPAAGQDDRSKDKAAAAKVEAAAQTTVKVDTAATAAAAASAAPSDIASPISQVVERILQELPAQNVTANADQVAQASKVLTVRLSPEGLGNVLVRISNAGGTLKISVASEQKATGDQLKSDSSQLLQALQQVMPSFSSDSLSFSTQDQGSGNAQTNNGASQSAMGGNSNSGQWNEGQSNAEQGNRQVSGRSYSIAQGASEPDTVGDAGRGQRSGSVYL